MLGNETQEQRSIILWYNKLLHWGQDLCQQNNEK